METTIKAKNYRIEPNTLVPLVRGELALSQEKLSRLLMVSSRSVARWEKEKKAPVRQETLERLAQLKKIITIGRKIYTAKGLNEFLSVPLSVFEGKSGYEMILLAEYEAVIGALAADYEGMGF